MSCTPSVGKTATNIPQPAPSVHTCPACGQRAKKVQRITMEHLLRPAATAQMGATQYYFCKTATCPVVYFPYQAGAAAFEKADLRVRVGLKETEDPIPICYCFDVTQERIRDEIRETGTSKVANRIKAEVQAGRCACERKNPSGQCCLGNVILAIQGELKAIQVSASAVRTIP